MVALYIKILKPSANFTKLFRGTYERLLLFHDHLQCLDNKYEVGDVVPNTRKFKICGSELKFFASILRKFKEIII